MFRSTPLCEVCQQRAATAIVGFRRVGEATVSTWKFTCSNETASDETESFSIEAFLASADATVDCLAHLHQSGRIDWQSFMDMMVRMRDACRVSPAS